VIHDLDRSIKELLTIELPDVDSNRVEVAFEPPNRDWRRTGPALNFFLYDVRENAELRQHQLTEVVHPNGLPRREKGMVTRERTPLRIDCFYIVTAWGETPFDEHMLLSQCMMALARHPVLNRYQLLHARQLAAAVSTNGQAATAQSDNAQASQAKSGKSSQQATPRSTQAEPEEINAADFVQGNLRNETVYELRTRIANHDVMTNPAEIWSSLENTMKAGFSYVVNLPLRPWDPFDTEQVESVRLRIGATEASFNPDRPDEAGELKRIATYETLLALGGTICNALDNDLPLADVEVQIEDSGLYTKTDADGRFYFNRILFDNQEFTLTATHPSGTTASKKVKIPVEGMGEYNVTMKMAVG